LSKLIWVVLITIVFVGVEVCGGFFSNSIAILSDAAHLTSDALGISISIIALKIAERNANDSHTFGYHRAEVLGALVSILFIWVITIWLMVEATYRFINPLKIDSEIMLIVSGLCLIFNLIQMSILHSKEMHDFAHAPGQSCGHDHGDHGNGDSHNHNHNHDHSHSHGQGKCSHNHSQTNDQTYHHHHDNKSNHDCNHHSEL